MEERCRIIQLDAMVVVYERREQNQRILKMTMLVTPAVGSDF